MKKTTNTNTANTTTAAPVNPFDGMTAAEILAEITAATPAAEITARITAAKAALVPVNEKARAARINEIFALVPAAGDKAPAIREYLNNPTYTADTVCGPNTDGEYSVKPAARFIPFNRLDTEYRKTDKKGTFYAHRDYADKLTAYGAALMAYQKRDANDTKAPSIGTLTKALQDVCDAFFPADMAITARRCDAKYLIATAFKAAAGEYTRASNSALQKHFIVAMGKAMRGESYAVNQNAAVIKAEERKAEKEREKAEKEREKAALKAVKDAEKAAKAAAAADKRADNAAAKRAAKKSA